ncbi:MAG: glycosyltransferase family 2 protein, partial [Leucobacter sp.]|nr:glycosyltransferase family 2 protein [Leucobacter sp.]
YDPYIRRGEDWELNLRIRRAGGLVWFEPALGVTYWPRASYSALAKQFFATGAWRAVLVRRYPAETPWRFFAPGTLVLSLAISLIVLVLQVCGVTPWPWWSLVHLIWLVYLLGVVFASTRLPGIRGSERVRGCAALIIMHLCWGSGFLFGLVGGAGRTVDRSRV